MNSIQNQNLSFMSKNKIINRGLNHKKFKVIAEQYKNNEYFSALSKHYDVETVATQDNFNGITLNIHCSEESKQKNKFMRLLENITDSNHVFTISSSGSLKKQLEFLKAEPLHYWTIMSDNTHQLTCTDFRISCKTAILRKLKDSISTAKKQADKSKAIDAKKEIEFIGMRQTNELFEKECEKMKKECGPNTKFKLIIDRGENTPLPTTRFSSAYNFYDLPDSFSCRPA